MFDSIIGKPAAASADWDALLVIALHCVCTSDSAQRPVLPAVIGLGKELAVR